MSCKGLSELAEMPADELERYLNKQTKKKLIDMLLDEFLNEVEADGFEDESESEDDDNDKREPLSESESETPEERDQLDESESDDE